MKEYRLNLIGKKDIIIEVPEGMEVSRDEAFSLAIVEMQKKIADGLIPFEVTKRFWPCIFCGKSWNDQFKLLKHLDSDSHQRGKMPKLEKFVERLYKPQKENAKDE